MSPKFSQQMIEYLEERKALEEEIQKLERKIKIIEKIIASIDTEIGARIEKEEKSQ